MGTSKKILWSTSLAMGAFALVACNSMTGADRWSDDDDDDGGGSEASGPSVGAGFTVGNGTGGAMGVGGSNGATMASGSAGQGAGPPACTYPSGPYGVGEGETVPPTLSWEGYAPGASAPGTITAEDFFDCDGQRGIHAVIVDSSQYG
ncbi:MAG: hypothetical protein AAGA56_11370 [Myxococcota bacterium]